MVALLPAGGSGFGWRSAPGALAHGGAPSCWWVRVRGGGQPQVLSRMVALLPAGWLGSGVSVSPRCSRAWWRSFRLVGPGSGWRSAPGALAHGGAPSCCVPVARYIDRLYTTDRRLDRKSVV